MTPRWARHAARVAAPLAPQELCWVARGGTPDLVNVAMKPKIVHQRGCNEGDHLAESRCPEMLRQLEATHMFNAGVLLLGRAFGIADVHDSTGMSEIQAHSVKVQQPRAKQISVGDSVYIHSLQAAPQHNGKTGIVQSPLHDGRHSVSLSSKTRLQVKPANLRPLPTHFNADHLRAGAQLIGDAYLADEKCATGTPNVASLLLLSISALNNFDNTADGFLVSAYAFYYAGQTMLHVSFRELGAAATIAYDTEARRFLDALIECKPWAEVAQTDVCALWRRTAASFLARLLFMRSYDKLTRFGDSSGGFSDLDQAITLDPGASYLDARVPVRLSTGNLSGTKEDVEAWLKTAHGDHRNLYSTLYAYAAIVGRAAVGKPSEMRRAKAIYERGIAAERRHRYLYGRVDATKKPDMQSGLEVVAAWAHTSLATPSQRSMRVRDEMVDIVGPTELSGSIDDLLLNEAEEPPHFAVGDSVIVHGLSNARQHNGSLGIVKNVLSNGRCAVELSHAVMVQVKPTNLRRASTQSAAAAAGAVSHGDRTVPDESPDDLMSQARDLMGQASKAVMDSQERQVPTMPDLQECQAAIAACTDVKHNKDHPTDDGDQSFLRAAIKSDVGMRLKRARFTGMDCSALNLSTFSRACYMGDLETVEAALALVRRKPKASRELLERRELLMRFSPLLCCIAGSQRFRVVGPEGVTSEVAAGMPPLPQHAAVARVLLDAGANPNAKDVAGFTPFHLACDKDMDTALEIAAMLPAYGGDPNRKNRFGAVPLIDATQGRSLRAIHVLVEAGADPMIEDDSSGAALTEAERTSQGAEVLEDMARLGIRISAAEATQINRQYDGMSPKLQKVSPFSLARQFPAAQQLFSRAVIRNAEDQHPACSAQGCDRPAPNFCKKCRRAWYCSSECQASDWKTGNHKEMCKTVRGSCIQYRILFDHPLITALARQQHEGSRGTQKRFNPDKSHTVKIQLSLDPLTMTPDPAPAHVLGYDRLRARVFVILANENEHFDALVRAIGERGMGGVKGYFVAWGVGATGDVIDLDVRCMMPIRPF